MENGTFGDLEDQMNALQVIFSQTLEFSKKLRAKVVICKISAFQIYNLLQESMSQFQLKTKEDVKPKKKRR